MMYLTPAFRTSPTRAWVHSAGQISVFPAAGRTFRIAYRVERIAKIIIRFDKSGLHGSGLSARIHRFGMSARYRQAIARARQD